MNQTPEQVTLRSNARELVIDFASGTPVIQHFGRVLEHDSVSAIRIAMHDSVPHADLDEYINPGIWRENARGFHGRPALLGHRAGQDWSQKFEIESVTYTSSKVSITALDSAAGLRITSEYELHESGALFAKQRVTNLGNNPFAVNELNIWLPIPDHITETMDFTGRWVKERQPQRREIQVGIWSREIREGRSGHDQTIVQLAMTQGANFQNGEVYSVGLQWSGNSSHLVEKLSNGRSYLGAGELLLPGEILLGAGESYETPAVVITYSSEGIDGISDTHYRWLRSRPNHPTNVKPRPLTLNVWEAVYMDHNLAKLTELADVAQAVGVERFVLDDGWFGSRRTDESGLGDWVVATEVWPNGLQPLIHAVHARGMEFGLWFEGEMVNPNSNVYRAHPDWILKVGDRVPPKGRHQQVLDLTNPEAYAHVLGQVEAILSEYQIDYIKWDHNRTLIEAAHLGRAAVHNQTQAIYRLFDELKANHPGLEIESCASGGGRIDLGMTQHADRFWTSDCNDALERQQIQRYTQVAIPPELLGSHIGPTKAHTTFRTHNLAFRAITALFGHAGLEWDITEVSDSELGLLKSWAVFYKQQRGLIHSGRMVRVDQPDSSVFLQGVVAQNRSEALFSYVTIGAISGQTPSAIRLTGLQPDVRYLVKAVYPAGEPTYVLRAMPQWLSGVELTGAALAQIGLRPPIMAPENALLIQVTRL